MFALKIAAAICFATFGLVAASYIPVYKETHAVGCGEDCEAMAAAVRGFANGASNAELL